MSILAGTLFVVAMVVVLPGAAIVGAVYVQYLMETRPPRGSRRLSLSPDYSAPTPRYVRSFSSSNLA